MFLVIRVNSVVQRSFDGFLYFISVIATQPSAFREPSRKSKKHKEELREMKDERKERKNSLLLLRVVIDLLPPLNKA